MITRKQAMQYIANLVRMKELEAEGKQFTAEYKSLEMVQNRSENTMVAALLEMSHMVEVAKTRIRWWHERSNEKSIIVDIGIALGLRYEDFKDSDKEDTTEVAVVTNPLTEWE